MLITRRLQRTIARDAGVRGIGFFHGADVTLRFRPAPVHSGIVFVRTDLPGCPSVPAHIRHVIPQQRRTTLQRGEALVEMVEHVLAALAGLRIDNCTVELDAPETPGCDGSSRAFVEALGEAGLVEFNEERKALVIDEAITVRDGQSSLTAYPGDGSGLVLSYQLDYGRRTSIGAQSLFLDVNPESFRAELAASRTFLLESEAVALRQAGIGSRTTESDLLIFGPEGVIGNELRYPDECVRHKILDMVGDLSLLATDLYGHVVAHRSGHHLNAELVRKLISGVERAERGAPNTVGATLDIAAIMRILPHRYPFLLIDRVLECNPGRHIRALKNVSSNEPFFQGHWPGRPIMPGVLIIEAMAQAAGIMLADQVRPAERVAMIVSIDQVKIRRPVVPGDQLEIEVESVRVKDTTAQVQAFARVGERLSAEAKIRFVIVAAEAAA